jgi:hypothetical protein
MCTAAAMTQATAAQTAALLLLLLSQSFLQHPSAWASTAVHLQQALVQQLVVVWVLVAAAGLVLLWTS